MSLKSPTQTLFNQDGYAVAVKEGVALSENSAALLLAGSDGADTHYISLDSDGQKFIVGAGTAGTPEGGVLSLQGIAGGIDMPVHISNLPTDQSIVQDNASELLASVGGLGSSGSAIVGNPVRLALKNDGDGTTVDLLSDSSGRLIAVGAASDGDPLAGAPIRIGASDGSNAFDVLSDSDGRLIMVGAAADGSAVAGAPLRSSGSDGSDTQDLRTDSDGRLIAAGAAADGSAVSGSPVRLGASDGTLTQNILSDDQGRLIRVGAAAAGSAPAGNPLLTGGWDGTNVQIFKLDSNGAVQTTQVKASEATLYETAATTSSASLLASNVAREGAMVFNDSNKFLYVKLGASASGSSFTSRVAPGGFYEVPAGFTGEISGIWMDASASGTARVTEIAPGGGGGGGGGFDPSSIGSLVAWYDASQITGIADGGVLSTWNDLSANGNHLNSTRSGETSPLWLSSASHGISLNGKPMVRFQASSLYRSSPTGLPTGSGATSIYIVGRQTNGSNWTSNAMFGWGSYSTGMWGIIKFGNGLFTAGNNNGSGYTNLFSKSGDSNPFIFSVQYSAGASLNGTPTYYNGTFGDSGTSTTPSISSPVAEISMGGSPADSSPIIDTYIAEVLVYNSAHSTGEKDQVQGYLAAKYGISI